MSSSIDTLFSVPRFRSPFDTVFPYYVMNMALSVLIILSLVFLGHVQKSFSILPHTFSMMLTVDRRHLRCFGVDTTLSPAYLTINSACTWVLRVSIVSVLCFIWQSCIMFQITTNISTIQDLTTIQEACNKGLVCFAYANAWDFILPWRVLSSAIQPLCKQPSGSSSPNLLPSADGSLITCIGIPFLDTLKVTVRIAVSYALYRLIIASFQLGAWVVYRSKGQLLQLIFFGLAVIAVILYIASLVVPHWSFSDTWFSSVSYLSIPMILFASRSVGLSVREEVSKRLSLRKNPEQWIGAIAQELETAIPHVHFQTGITSAPALLFRSSPQRLQDNITQIGSTQSESVPYPLQSGELPEIRTNTQNTN